MNWSWLSFIVGILVGWLLEWLIDFIFWRRKRRTEESEMVRLQQQLEDAQGRQRDLELKAMQDSRDLEACQAELDTCRTNLDAAQSAVVEAAVDATRTDAVAGTAAAVIAAAAAADEPAPEKQDLIKIEGIGPKISGLLHEAGIVNFALLAAAPVERLREVLAAAGSRYRLANPSTWPEQARLAAEEQWDELQALQDRLSGGREVDESGDE